MSRESNSTKESGYRKFVESVSIFIGFDISAIFTFSMVAWFWCWLITVTVQRNNGVLPTKNESIEFDSYEDVPVLHQSDLPVTTPINWLSDTLNHWFGTSPKWLTSFIDILDKVPHNGWLLVLGVVGILATSLSAGGVILDRGRNGDFPSDRGMHSIVLLLIMILSEYWGSFQPIMYILMAGAILPAGVALFRDAFDEKTPLDGWRAYRERILEYLFYSMITVGGWFFLVIGVPLVGIIKVLSLFCGQEHRHFIRHPERWDTQVW